ncbi:MAG: LLM class flavin-dependent oxidoreductase [Alcaligenaceae bacterium]|nr:LLM class flavin-dependent oxidoreductase [Alcaligenaceae bacterium SAGV5]MPS54838.1 LLM class flavin-dependent oxidoreductase [Alcaligenaceae bacterium SAGV3]MPT55444.1 LLM class flavin-dependent oxidoreductase [Alcaligenaceae bacterium]
MKFAVFDHMDRGTVPLAQQYEERLILTEAYDRGGFHAYHVAEHHSTPLGIAPSPSVYLSAVAQRTRRLRFGPLVYTLGMHHPLRVMEEICMLDQLSRGRLEVGFGRGISPYELGYYGVDPEQSQGIYHESYQIIMQGLTQPVVNFQGRHFDLRDVPVEMQCLQRPTPPIWYGAGTPAATQWTAANAINIVCNGPAAQVRAITDQYRLHWQELGHAADAVPSLGMSRHVVVADTDAQAMDAARRAYQRWYTHLMHLWVKHGTLPRTLSFPDNFDDAQRAGLGIAGSPATVRDWIAEASDQAGINYFVCRLAFGDLTLAESLRSTALMAESVLPALATSLATEA